MLLVSGFRPEIISITILKLLDLNRIYIFPNFKHYSILYICIYIYSLSGSGMLRTDDAMTEQSAIDRTVKMGQCWSYFVCFGIFFLLNLKLHIIRNCFTLHPITKITQLNWVNSLVHSANLIRFSCKLILCFKFQCSV